MQCVTALLCPAASVESTVSPRYRTTADRLCVVGGNVTVCQDVCVCGGGEGGGREGRWRVSTSVEMG